MNTPNQGKKDAFSMSLTGYTLKRIQTRKKQNSGISKLQKLKNGIQNNEPKRACHGIRYFL
jgi:hypothetical protein